MENVNNLLKRLSDIKSQSYWADRIISQLEYAYESERLYKFGYLEKINSAIRFVTQNNTEQGVITKNTVLSCEKSLMELSSHMKKFSLLCVSHAHIDMNWMWRYDETVAITLDTFRTMLDLMDEYPDFTYSQSQASVYKIVEEHDPVMLEQIKKRVKEGRWEVTASTWVEADKNMPSAESKAKHILYTKKYLSKLLDIPYDYFVLDYEPDTFGHSVNDPEVLAKAGIRYYYHARGFNKLAAYRWQAPSGASVLVYNDPTHYNGKISTNPVLLVPSFTYDTKHDTMLYVYGVGDHGGGPSRRDIERIKDMDKWPIWPNIRFSTYKEFFKSLEKAENNLPVIKDELNFIFTGCYSSQSPIKKGNKASEALLYEAESLSALASVKELSDYDSEKIQKAWEMVLFNQFHDIITGSGKVSTREYAMGEYQKVFATGNVLRSNVMRDISKNINLSDYIIAKDDELMTVSEGAGVGYGIDDLQISKVSRGRGPTRVFTVFNPSSFERKENAVIDIWNWDYDISSMEFFDGKKQKVSHQLISDKANRGWGGQYYYRVIIEACVPAFGYTTYILKSNPETALTYKYQPKDRTIDFPKYTLENEHIKVCFDAVNASITSFIDKATSKEYVDSNKPTGVFRYIEENTLRKMTSWIVGRYMNIEDISKNIKITDYHTNSASLRQYITFTASFKESKLNVTVNLDKSSSTITYDVSCDWKEFGIPDKHIPQLNFHMPFDYSCEDYCYEVPFGTKLRKDADDDRPSTGFVMAINSENDKSLVMFSDSKYGFRTQDNSLSLTLIRGSYDPDPYPEIGLHKFKFSIGLFDKNSLNRITKETSCIIHPLSSMSVKPQKGHLPMQGSLLDIKETGSCIITAIKKSEYVNNGIVIRIFEAEGKNSSVALDFGKKIKKAEYISIDEITGHDNKNLIISECSIIILINPYCIETILIEFE